MTQTEQVDQALEDMHLLDVVSRRTRVSYRDIRQTFEELQTVLGVLHDLDFQTDEDEMLLKALKDHPDVQNYTLPTEEARRMACVKASNLVDRHIAKHG